MYVIPSFDFDVDLNLRPATSGSVFFFGAESVNPFLPSGALVLLPMCVPF
jgi:hypothetical protein